jgi:protein-L-isoaspartate(D-aspartate) O-methyltransferase
VEPELDQAPHLNQHMVDRLAAQGYVQEARVEQAFRSVPRHRFLPTTPLAEVYSGRAIVTHRGANGLPVSSSSEPAVMARMLEQLDVHPGQQVLEVGAGTGYNAALLGHLVAPGGSVTTIDLDPGIAATARRHLQSVGTSAVTVIAGDGWAGSPPYAPYDRIEVTVGTRDLSPAWFEQLSADGVLVMPLWLRAGLQASVAFIKRGDRLQSLSIEPCGFMLLRGPAAGPETYVSMGAWNAGLDGSDPDTVALLDDLVQQDPRSEPAPDLGSGWFTPIALSQAGAVTLVSFHEKRPRICQGIIDSASRSLAVIESGLVDGCMRPTTMHAFGGGEAHSRLEGLIGRLIPLNVGDLSITAVPTADPVREDPDVLALLHRPNFTVVVQVAS